MAPKAPSRIDHKPSDEAKAVERLKCRAAHRYRSRPNPAEARDQMSRVLPKQPEQARLVREACSGGVLVSPRRKEAPAHPGLQGHEEMNLEEETSPGSATISNYSRRAMKKLLRPTAIGFSYRRYVAAYPSGWIHRALSPNQNR